MNDFIRRQHRKETDVISSPAIQDWEKLYQAATEFKEVGAWNWMWDSDIFGVLNPADGEIGYCCILGRRGEYFALVVYLGTEGLSGYLNIQSGEIDIEDWDTLHLKKCLVASFEDRRFLSKKDINVIKELSLTFKGHNAWPLFRSYQPGYFPWYLTKEEVEYLILCLRQAKEVASRFKKVPNILMPPKKITTL